MCRPKMPPRRARRFTGSPAILPSLLGSWFRGFRIGCASVHAVGWFARTIRDRLPSRYPLQNALGIFGRRDVTVIVLDHLDGGAHLLCQEIYVDAFHQAVGGIGVWHAGPQSRIISEASRKFRSIACFVIVETSIKPCPVNREGVRFANTLKNSPEFWFKAIRQKLLLQCSCRKCPATLCHVCCSELPR